MNRKNTDYLKEQALTMSETSEEKEERSLPFQNLYLISGLVNGFNKGWMYFFTVLFLIFGYISFQVLAFLPLQYLLIKNGYSESEIIKNTSLLLDSNALGIDRNYVFLAELGMFVFACLGFIAGIRMFHRKPLLSVLSGYEKFRYRRLFFGFAVWGGLVVLATVLEYLIAPNNFQMKVNVTGLIISILIAFTLMPIQSGLEEVFFRGYLVQGFSQIFRNGIVPLLITSFLFGFAHMSNPEVKEYGWPIMLFYYCSFGLFMGAITLLDEGLELALGIHMANNIVSGILVTDPHAVIKSYSLLESSNINVISELIMWFIMAAICFSVFWLKYRWKNFSLILK
jgi:membrane protease YdiL (CAAX protease family)